jgi:hypothetical protein
VAHFCAPRGGSGDLSKPAELTERRWPQFLWAASLLAILVGSLLVSLRLVLFPLGFIIAGLLCIPHCGGMRPTSLLHHSAFVSDCGRRFGSARFRRCRPGLGT